jgi:hypothetical protein
VTHAVATVAPPPVPKTLAGLLAQATHTGTGVAGALIEMPAQAMAQGLTHAIAGLTGPLLKALTQGPLLETLAQGLGQITHAPAGLTPGPTNPSTRVANAVSAAVESAAARTRALQAPWSITGARSLLGWPAPQSTSMSGGGSPAWGPGGVRVAAAALPRPAPVQGFAFPASAGNAGFGFSILLMLAGLLLLGALLVSGRLRLSSELWRPAPFVLILDRPG